MPGKDETKRSILRFFTASLRKFSFTKEILPFIGAKLILSLAGTAAL
jgi:hypothetical protein